MKKKIRVSIVGARGYTGQELVRILLKHPHVELVHLYATEQGVDPFGEEFPAFYGKTDLTVEKWELESWKKDEDLFFLALPHGVSMSAVPTLLKGGVKVVDLSADYRIQNVSLFEKWYHAPHHDETHLKKAVYGLPELHRDEIQEADLVANPGCYPTSAILACAPLFQSKEVDFDSIIIDSKSGVSGAGRKASLATQFAEVSENFKAYGVTTHRHTPEIEEQLSMAFDQDIQVNFTPHLLPINRGILSTVYLNLKKKLHQGEVLARVQRFYKKEPFVRVRESEKLPEIRDVVGTNYCDIGVRVDPRTSRIVLISVIDNLIKGASGQAVHNMNLMYGFDETTGLI